MICVKTCVAWIRSPWRCEVEGTSGGGECLQMEQAQKLGFDLVGTFLCSCPTDPLGDWNHCAADPSSAERKASLFLVLFLVRAMIYFGVSRWSLLCKTT